MSGRARLVVRCMPQAVCSHDAKVSLLFVTNLNLTLFSKHTRTHTHTPRALTMTGMNLNFAHSDLSRTHRSGDVAETLADCVKEK